MQRVLSPPARFLRDDFRQAPSDVVVAAGEPAVLECVPPRGHPEPTVSWKRNNARIAAKDQRISMRGGKLMISHTRKSDAGMYVCVGSNMVGERDSDPAELVVYERPVLMRPAVKPGGHGGETWTSWRRHGDPAPTCAASEEGSCPGEVRNDGQATNPPRTSVPLPPQISIKPRDQIAVQGASATFHCGTTGNPPPAIFWQKEGSQDSGFYICQAISVAGSVLTKALLEVEGGPSGHIPPIIRQGPANQTLSPGTTAQLHCHVI
ncbi:hypothetical protein CRUP_015100, partial [Coryphaenoides rupestris]